MCRRERGAALLVRLPLSVGAGCRSSAPTAPERVCTSRRERTHKRGEHRALSLSAAGVAMHRAGDGGCRARAGLSWRCGAVCIPHPDKAEKGGEDAYFVAANALGVFDGVGGWASIGVDPGLYSRQLARLTATRLYGYMEGEAHAQSAAVAKALAHATEENSAVGSSTACVMSLSKDTLNAVNLGDSGLIVIRDGKVLARTAEQQHYFNCPFQLGTDSVDTVDMASRLELELRHGDWVIAATDGLWDNVFVADVVDVVYAHHVDALRREGRPLEQPCPSSDASSESSASSESGASTVASATTTLSASDSDADAEDARPLFIHADPDALAQSLAEVAQRVAMDEKVSSPFAVNAQSAGHIFLGGKLDDITVVAALVVDTDIPGVDAPPQLISNSDVRLDSVCSDVAEDTETDTEDVSDSGTQ